MSAILSSTNQCNLMSMIENKACDFLLWSSFSSAASSNETLSSAAFCRNSLHSTPVLCCKIRIMEFKIMCPMMGLWAGLGSCACRETILLMDVNLVVRKGVDHDKVAVFLVVYWWLSSMQSETRYHFDSMNSNESWQKNPNSCWHEAHIVYGLKTQLTSSILFSVVWRCTGNPLALIAAGTHNRPSSSNGRGELTFCSKYLDN